MNKTIVSLSAIAVGVASMAFAQAGVPSAKVGVINIQAALIGTRDGQKAAQDLDAKRAPKQKELEGKQNSVNQLRDALNKGSNTMAPEQRTKLVREIDQRTTSLNRDLEDAQAEFEQDQQKILSDLGQRIMAVIDKFARDNTYTLILDVSSPQTPVLYATNQIDITQEIIKLYDAQTPGNAVPATTRPAVSAPVVPRPTGIAPARKK